MDIVALKLALIKMEQTAQIYSSETLHEGVIQLFGTVDAFGCIEEFWTREVFNNDDSIPCLGHDTVYITSIPFSKDYYKG